MAKIVIRHLEGKIKDSLQRRATRHGRSMEEEIAQILLSAVREGGCQSMGFGDRVAARFAGIVLEQDFPELRSQSPCPADFGV
jgi:plasmid stability protein